MKNIFLLALCFLPLLAPAQDTARVIYKDPRYMVPTFVTKNGFQVYDLKECDEKHTDCPPDGRFIMYADSAQKRKLYEGLIINGMREGLWNYFDKKGNTMSEEEYSAGEIQRVTLYKEGEAYYERTYRAPIP